MMKTLLFKRLFAVLVMASFSLVSFSPVVYAAELNPRSQTVPGTLNAADFPGIIALAAQEIESLEKRKEITAQDARDAKVSLLESYREFYRDSFEVELANRLSVEHYLISQSVDPSISAFSIPPTRGNALMNPQIFANWRDGIRSILRCSAEGVAFDKPDYDAECVSGVSKEKLADAQKKGENTASDYDLQGQAAQALVSQVANAKRAMRFTYETNPTVRVLLKEYAQSRTFSDVDYVNAMLEEASALEKEGRYAVSLYTLTSAIQTRFIGNDDHARLLLFLNSLTPAQRQGYSLMSACLDEGHNLGELASLTRDAYVGKDLVRGAELRVATQNTVLDSEGYYQRFKCLRNDVQRYLLLVKVVNTDQTVLDAYRNSDINSPQKLSAFLKNIEAAKALALNTQADLLEKGKLDASASRTAIILLADARSKKLISSHAKEFEAAKPGFYSRI
ncbi:MAG: hypothetical protein Q8P02_04285, partial [Candidatus Micrarchaeota archaeon]|nr:hypothetical protein [Candidatus Micrarchaeota archaeon]